VINSGRPGYAAGVSLRHVLSEIAENKKVPNGATPAITKNKGREKRYRDG